MFIVVSREQKSEYVLVFAVCCYGKYNAVAGETIYAVDAFKRDFPAAYAELEQTRNYVMWREDESGKLLTNF